MPGIVMAGCVGRPAFPNAWQMPKRMNESLLNCSRGDFLLVTEDENGKADGCYLSCDSDGHRFFRPGASCTNKGMIGRR
jgi:hypothetical protein